jgi:hypothetical protein
MIAIPQSIDELTAPWLTDALRAGGAPANTRVISLDVQPYAVGRSRTGEIALLSPVYETPDDSLPDQIIAKLVSQNEANRQNATKMGAFPREVQFYRTMAQKCRSRFPACSMATSTR